MINQDEMKNIIEFLESRSTPIANAVPMEYYNRLRDYALRLLSEVQSIRSDIADDLIKVANELGIEDKDSI